MDDAFARALAEWSGFYTLFGGAAATLLGLLFVALSLRLNVFRDQALADVRDFATFAFVTFLAAVVIAALTLVPHAHVRTVAIVVGLVGVMGLILLAWVGQAWIRLNVHHAGPQRGSDPEPTTTLLVGLLGLGAPIWVSLWPPGWSRHGSRTRWAGWPSWRAACWERHRSRVDHVCPCRP